jgi:hypothetical protein
MPIVPLVTFLDAILHLPAGAVRLFVQGLRFVAQIGHHEARVVAFGVVLGIGDQAPVARQAARPTEKFTEQALRPRVLKLRFPRFFVFQGRGIMPRFPLMLSRDPVVHELVPSVEWRRLRL